MVKKTPNPIDVHVGGKVRLRRTMMNMSQDTLGKQLGITFQQIQKYEKGINRIGASRLQHIAQILQVPVSFFFEDAPTTNLQIDGLAEPPRESYLTNFLSSSEGLELNRAFMRINDGLVRKKVVELIRALADKNSDIDS